MLTVFIVAWDAHSGSNVWWGNDSHWSC